VLLGCFVLALFNHISILFEEMKDHYARMMVLGCSHWRLIKILMIEKFVLWIVIVVASLISGTLIGRQLMRIVLFFGEYEPISIDLATIGIGIGIASVIYVAANVFYMYRTIQIHAANVLKIHQ
jgi:putative ABC transport system permease protein